MLIAIIIVIQHNTIDNPITIPAIVPPESQLPAFIKLALLSA